MERGRASPLRRRAIYNLSQFLAVGTFLDRYKWGKIFWPLTNIQGIYKIYIKNIQGTDSCLTPEIPVRQDGYSGLEYKHLVYLKILPTITYWGLSPKLKCNNSS
jgi:hypothetical protein